MAHHQPHWTQTELSQQPLLTATSSACLSTALPVNPSHSLPAMPHSQVRSPNSSGKNTRRGGVLGRIDGAFASLNRTGAPRTPAGLLALPRLSQVQTVDHLQTTQPPGRDPAIPRRDCTVVAFAAAQNHTPAVMVLESNCSIVMPILLPRSPFFYNRCQNSISPIS